MGSHTACITKHEHLKHPDSEVAFIFVDTKCSA